MRARRVSRRWKNRQCRSVNSIIGAMQNLCMFNGLIPIGLRLQAIRTVLAGPVPAIHVFAASKKQDMDARHKAEHDDWLDCRNEDVRSPCCSESGPISVNGF